MNFVTPDPNRVHGLDISHWAGAKIDFSKAKDAGAKFAFIKAKDGYKTDRWFKVNWKQAEGHLFRGAYLWLYPSRFLSANTQARKLAELLDEVGHGELPPVVDLEKSWWNRKITYPKAKDAYGFVKTYEDITGIKPIIYTSPAYWDRHGSEDGFWKWYRLWIANYGRAEAPIVPKPWDSYTFWQWTTRGDAGKYGVDRRWKKQIDLNYFNGTLGDLRKMAGVTVVTQPVEPPSIAEEIGEPYRQPEVTVTVKGDVKVKVEHVST